LHVVQTPRGVSEALFLGDGDEMVELTKLHYSSVLIRGTNSSSAFYSLDTIAKKEHPREA
jgi:hypothetical protein